MYPGSNDPTMPFGSTLAFPEIMSFTCLTPHRYTTGIHREGLVVVEPRWPSPASSRTRRRN